MSNSYKKMDGFVLLTEAMNSVINKQNKPYIVMEGLVEVHKDGKVVVLTSNYIPVIVSDNLESNQIVSIKINRVDENNLVYGSVIL